MGAWDEGERRIFMHDREQSGAVSGRDECRLRDGAWLGVTWRVVCGVSCGRWRGNGCACCIFRRKQSGLCARVGCLLACATPVRRRHYRLLYLFAAVFYARIFTSSPNIPDSSFCLPWAVSRISTPAPVPSHCFAPLILFSPLSLSRLSASPPRPPLAVH
jgi:hypothetical protein